MPLAIVENLKPGDEVRQDVLNLNGMLLFSKGTILTERHIHLLKMWGVETINVQGIGGTTEMLPQMPIIAQEYMQKAGQQLAVRLKYVSEELSIVRRIKMSAHFRLAQQLAREKTPPVP
jgi:hypothetical protein